MGCLGSKERGKSNSKENEQQVFSWDRADRPNPADYTIADREEDEAGRKPGTVNGQQFIIRNCKNTRIYIFDNSATITVDDCENCKIFLGPVKGSVYLRNCKECQCIIACQQFRTRDCYKIDTLLCCATQPIIESSRGMKFGCFQFSYPELAGQFQKAGLSVFNNNWSNIHDFTPVSEESNHGLLTEHLDMTSFLPRPTGEELSSVEISTEHGDSVVPLTKGSRRKTADESCLVVLMGDSATKADKYLSCLRKQETKCDIVQTKEVRMSVDDANRVFRTEKYSSIVEKGPVVGMEFNGLNCTEMCKSSIVAAGLDQASVFVSLNKESSQHDIDAFYNFSDMSMS